MKLYKWVLLFTVCFSLQACKLGADEQVIDEVKKPNPVEAAGYNVQLGLAYLKQGNMPRAKRKLLTAVKQAPNSPDANAALGYYMEKTGEIERAKYYYQKAMALAPGRGTQLNNYGTFLCRRGEYTEAENYFLKAVNDVQYEHTSGAYENAGLCSLAAQKEDKAEQFFKKALEQDPYRKQSLIELVKLGMKRHQDSVALAQLQKHPEIVLRSKELLALAIQAAHQAKHVELEENYRRSLENFGVKHHDDNSNDR